jgi:hypothetical protein
MIFISYSIKDKAPFSSLCLALEAAGLPYWKGELKAGASLKEQLKEAISKCDVCIFIATRSSVTSQWCLNEIGAFWGAGKRIILYSANPDIENKLPPLFKGDHWTCDAREVISQVKEELKGLAGKATPKGIPRQAETKQPASTPALQGKEKQILRYLFRPDSYPYLEQITAAIRLPSPEETKYYLQRLIEGKYIARPPDINSTVHRYKLEQKGREYVIKNNLHRRR